MKLHEILDKEINIPRSDKAVSGFMYSKNLSIIGSGIQSIVYASKKYPNAVVKVVYITGSDDPVYQFLRVCLNNKGNPFFPKIYNVKQYNAKEMTAADHEYADQFCDVGMAPDYAKQLLVMVVEKLADFNKLSQPTQHEILDNLGITVENALKVGVMSTAFHMDRDQHTLRKFSMGHLFRRADGRALLRKLSTDKNFSNALRVLEPLFKHFDADMHFNNVMVRPGSEQLVIVDPVSRIYPE